MTSIAVSSDNWGERRLAERTARRRRRKGLVVGVGLLFMLAVPFLAHVWNAWTGRGMETGPGSTASIIMAFGFLSLVGYSAWRSWHEIDEVQRRRAVNAWAALGMAALVLRPVLNALQPLLHLSDPAHVAWLGALAIWAATVIYQRVRS